MIENVTGFAEALAKVQAAGFTEHVYLSENGDQGDRIYYARPGAARNEHGWPLEHAQLDQWQGEDRWTANLPGRLFV